nr:MAG TPA: hypothetical protein [Caudoviricetes sp.]
MFFFFIFNTFSINSSFFIVSPLSNKIVAEKISLSAIFTT